MSESERRELKRLLRLWAARRATKQQIFRAMALEQKAGAAQVKVEAAA